MRTTRGTRQPTFLRTALRGAAAGVAGGVAVALLEREVLPRMAGGAPHRSAWDERAAGALRRAGVRVRGRGAIAAGVGSQLVYLGLLGAAYAVLRERTNDSLTGRTLLGGAMTYAVGVVYPPPARPGRRALTRLPIEPADPAAIFSRTMAAALALLAR